MASGRRLSSISRLPNLSGRLSLIMAGSLWKVRGERSGKTKVRSSFTGICNGAGSIPCPWNAGS